MNALSPARLAAQQVRSTETHNRLLTAAEELLAEKSFDDTSVAEIAERAGVTTGAFYARFRDKEAVLELLEERLHGAIEDGLDELLRDPRGRELPAEQILNAYHARLIESTRKHQGVARALVVRAQAHGPSHRRLERISTSRMNMAAHAVLERGGIKHQDGAKAVGFIFLAVRSTSRAMLLFNQSWPGTQPLSDEALVGELTRMVMSYLGIEAQQP